MESQWNFMVCELNIGLMVILKKIYSYFWENNLVQLDCNRKRSNLLRGSTCEIGLTSDWEFTQRGIFYCVASVWIIAFSRV